MALAQCAHLTLDDSFVIMWSTLSETSVYDKQIMLNVESVKQTVGRWRAHANTYD